MLDDYRSTMGIALIIMGYSPNTTDINQIAEAAEFLIGQSAHIGDYISNSAQDLLLAGDYDMIMEWSGDVLQIMEDNPDLRYVIPEEGSIKRVDNICVPAGAANKPMAEAFINHLLDPETGATLSSYIQYASPNMAVLPLLKPEDLNNPTIYPPDETQNRLFYLIDVNLAAAELYETAWQEILFEHGQ